MKNAISLCFLIIISSLSFGQTFKISGCVSDSQNHQVLSYASVMVFNHPIGISTDKKGFFELTLPDSLKMDSLVITYIGYKPRHLCINACNNDTIVLEPLTINLSEVFIKPSLKKPKSIIVNEFKIKDCEITYSKEPFNGRGTLYLPYRAKEPSIESIYIPYDQSYGSVTKIKEIWIYLKSFNSTPTFSRIRIFKAGNGLKPTEDLLTDPIDLIVAEKSQLLKIDLGRYNLTLPGTGLFVGVEVLIIPENAREFQNNLGDKTTLYSPFLYYFPAEESEYKFWLFSKGTWVMQSLAVPEYLTRKPKNLFYKPAISLVLSE